MNEKEIEDLLNYYPYLQSVNHQNKTLNKDWYPISSNKKGYQLCPCCDQYGGNKLSQYNSYIINKKIIVYTYFCCKCSCIFDVCQTCFSYCVIVNERKKDNNKEVKDNIYNKIKKLNKSLINIIYQYSLFDKLYTYYTEEEKIICYCPRCEKKQQINKTDLY